jgi:L-alanine-DL-glutamate epimerase-like enolase superfamily enzyme
VPRSTDIRPLSATLYFLPVTTRVPLKFGPETLTSVTCARVRLRVEGTSGRTAEGWGETPLSVQWVWPSQLSYEERHQAMRGFTTELAGAWKEGDWGHPLAIGHCFLEERLPGLLSDFNERRGGEPMPWLAALVCCSAFDIALHDGYGVLHGVPVYETYNARYLSADLSRYLTPAAGSGVTFAGLYPEDFLVRPRPQKLPAWHLVGGKDLLHDGERDGSEPDDGYPVVLREWIERDGLRCLKVKLRGDDERWDRERLVEVGRIAIQLGADWLSADFNCTVTEAAYVNAILDRLLGEEPRIYGMLLYVEQPFPYDLENHRIDVHSVSARKPLFMDESAHDWRLVKLGRELGWTGVALKTCKTQTGALLSLAWAKAHGMTLMVQDLTNPMLAQVPHVLLAAHAGTIRGVETNAMQFYPEASSPEAAVHTGIHRRRGGEVDLSTIRGPGFGYRLEEIERELPPAVVSASA